MSSAGIGERSATALETIWDLEFEGVAFMFFRSLRNKLLVLIILLSLLPLVGISLFSYFVGSKQIAEDRIKLALENKAQDTADKIDLLLRAQEQDMPAMASTFSLIYPSFGVQDRVSMIRLLDNYCFNHEVYIDVLAVVDSRGEILAINTRDRSDKPLAPEACDRVCERTSASFPRKRNCSTVPSAGFHRITTGTNPLLCDSFTIIGTRT